MVIPDFEICSSKKIHQFLKRDLKLRDGKKLNDPILEGSNYQDIFEPYLKHGYLVILCFLKMGPY